MRKGDVLYLKKKRLDKKDGGRQMENKRFEQRPACAEIQMSFPMELTCPRCGGEIELWSDEGETICGLCGYLVFDHERFTN
jgi:DNA-directed RNA polymerase subunit RPC12/RpoP